MGTHPIFESDFDCLTEMSRDSVSTTDGYIGLTERIQRIANKTPDRFKRNPVNDENRRPVEIGRKRPTLARTPKCARDTKSSSMRAMRQAQKEKSGTDVKKRGARRIGAPRLATERRAAQKPVFEEEKPAMFKARPAPKFGNRSILSTNSSRMSLRSTTKVEPFSFDSRTRKKNAAADTEEKIEMDLPHRLGEIPDYGGIKGVPQKSKLTVTKPEPFKFQPRREKPTFDFSTKTIAHKADEEYMKKALAGHQLTKPAAKPVTVAEEPPCHLDRRGKERKEYEAKEAARRQKLEEEQRLEDEEKAKLEEVATKELRQKLIHKPEPIRNYKPAPEREFIEPTMPITPNAAREQNRQPRHSRRLRNKKPL